uniref:Odorant receptor n=1 Tax=Anopheles epiroticus TaxID=199890 RepID=A0A182PAD1_9DIPT
MEIIKLNVINPNWRPTIRSIIVIGSIFFFCWIEVPYSIKVYVQDYEILIETLSLGGCSTQLMLRMFLYLCQRERCVQIVSEIRKQRLVYGADSSPRMEEQFRLGTKRMLLFYRLIHLLYGVSYFFLLAPLILPDPHKFNLPLAVQIPFLPPGDNLVYYCINFVHHIMLNVFGVVHLAVIDGVLIMALISICTRIAGLQLLLEELDGKISLAEWYRTEHLDADLDHIIELHWETKKFFQVVSGTFQMHFCSLFSTMCIAICMCLNVVTKNPKSSLLPFGVSSVSQMFVICMFGNIVQIASSRLKDSVYGIQWYRMTVTQQKKLLFLLANSQPELIMKAIFVPVTVTSFVSIMRAAYSYYTILS